MFFSIYTFSILTILFFLLWGIEKLLTKKKKDKDTTLYVISKINSFEFFDLVFFIIASLLSLYIMSLKDGLSGELFTRGDYAAYYGEAYFSLHLGLNSFWDVINAGFNSAILPHPGICYLLMLFFKIGIPLNIGLAIIVWFAITFSLYYPYLLGKRFGYSNFEACLGAFGSFSGASAISLISIGMIAFYYSVLVAIDLSVRIRPIFTDQLTIEEAIKISLLASLVFIFHFYSFLIVGLFVLLYVKEDFKRIQNQSFGKFIKNLLLIGVFTACLSAIFLGPFVYEIWYTNLLENKKIPKRYFEAEGVSLLLYGFYFEYILYSSFISEILFIWGWATFFKEKSTRHIDREKKIFGYSLVLMIFIFISTTLWIVFIDREIIFIFFFRYLLFIQVGSAVFISRAIRLLVRKTRKQGNKIPFSAFIIFIIINANISIENYRVHSFLKEDTAITSFQNWESSQNLNQSYRVMVEFSDLSNSIWHSTNVLIPIEYNTTIISTWSSQYWIERDVAFFEGFAFGKDILEFSLDEFKQKLWDYNVYYIVCFSNHSREFFQRYPDVFELEHKAEDGKYLFFRFKEPLFSYGRVIEGEGNITTLEFSPHQIRYAVINRGEVLRVRLSINNDPGWKIFINETQAFSSNDKGLIELTIHDKGNYSLTLEWKKQPFFVATEVLSLLFWVILPSSLGAISIKKRIKENRRFRKGLRKKREEEY